jgi:hypothetical protein
VQEIYIFVGKKTIMILYIPLVVPIVATVLLTILAFILIDMVLNDEL